MAESIRIVAPAPDGGLAMGRGTKVLTEDGAEIEGVRAIDIEIRPDAIVQAEVSLFVGGIDVHAHPLLSLETVEAAAKVHGYRLVSDDEGGEKV